MSGTIPLFRQWQLLRSISSAGGEAIVKSLVMAAGTSRKTIRCDLALLRKVGFPIEERSAKFGRKTYAVVDEGAPRLQFAYDEALALYLRRRTAVGFRTRSFAKPSATPSRRLRLQSGIVRPNMSTRCWLASSPGSCDHGKLNAPLSISGNEQAHDLAALLAIRVGLAFARLCVQGTLPQTLIHQLPSHRPVEPAIAASGTPDRPG